MTWPTTIEEAAAALRRGEVTSVELTSTLLAAADAVDGDLGTYLARFDQSSLAAAAQADHDLSTGTDRGPLHGIPIGVKDLLATTEGPTTAQSLVLDRSWGKGKDAPVVERLRQAGAVILGKLTTMEFAIGMPDPGKPFPAPANPWNLGHWSGGSSSGAGNGVAAHLMYGAIGTDTGGSIRIPAAFCGVSGLKPTYGRVPKSGCVPLGYSLDHVGPLARTAEDCALLLQVLAGPDPTDPASARAQVPDYHRALTGDIEGLRIGVPRNEELGAGRSGETGRRLQDALDVLASLGARLEDVVLPDYEMGSIASQAIQASESFAYHRNDLAERWDDYFAATRLWVGLGALMSGGDYVQAQRVRRHVGARARALFEHVDVVAMPTLATGAPSYAALSSMEFDPFGVSRSMYVGYWDLLGYPALSVPMGGDGTGLPLALQLVGPAFSESVVLRAGDAFQRATSWHREVPPLVTERLAHVVG